MTPKQYEEVCRLFLARQLGCDVAQIEAPILDQPTLPGEPGFTHQIDLYWQIEDSIGKFVLIANAKWHDQPHFVGQNEVLLIQKVRECLAAHKAVLLTNTGFSEPARAAAAQGGVALHIVRPLFGCGQFHASDAKIIQGQLQDLAKRSGRRPLYSHEVVHKGLGLTRTPDTQPLAATSSAGAAVSGLAGGASFAYPIKSLSGGKAPAPPPVPPAPAPQAKRASGFPYRTK